MIKKLFILSIILSLFTVIFAIIAPQNLADSYGGTSLLISLLGITLSIILWIMRFISQFFHKHTKIDSRFFKIPLVGSTGIFVLIMFTYLFVAQLNTIDGNSMEPTIANGSNRITNKLSYKLTNPKRGEIIIFHLPDAPDFANIDSISRIIAIPGDKIAINQGKVILNDKPLSETYISENDSTFSGEFAKDNQIITLGEDEYFVMGDNRKNSHDSRNYGFIKRTEIIGKIM